MESGVILLDGDGEQFFPGTPPRESKSPLPPTAPFSQLMVETNQINSLQPFLALTTTQQNLADSVGYLYIERTRDRAGVTFLFKPSKTAQQFICVRVPHSMRAASKVLFRYFANFVFDLLKQPRTDKN